MKSIVKVFLPSLLIIFLLAFYGCYKGPPDKEVKFIIEAFHSFVMPNTQIKSIKILEKGDELKNNTWPIRVRISGKLVNSPNNCYMREVILKFEKIQDKMGKQNWFSDPLTAEELSGGDYKCGVFE
jgi:hypothetical protein